MNLQFEVRHRRSSPIVWLVAILLGIAIGIGIENVFNLPCHTDQGCWDRRFMLP
jgi:hypothetical protein